MAVFDGSGKRTIHLFAKAWAEWVLEQENLEIEAELSGEFQVVARSTDVLLRVRSEAGVRFLALIELQTRYDSHMPQRLAAYAALAREKYRLEVFVIVLFMLPPPAGVAIPNQYRSRLSDPNPEWSRNLDTKQRMPAGHSPQSRCGWVVDS